MQMNSNMATDISTVMYFSGIPYSYEKNLIPTLPKSIICSLKEASPAETSIIRTTRNRDLFLGRNFPTG